MFDALLAQGWTAEKETEAFALLYEIDFAPADKDRLQVACRVGALMKLDNWVLAGSYRPMAAGGGDPSVGTHRVALPLHHTNVVAP